MSDEAPQEIRFVDLCAGLGGFHQALKYVADDHFSPDQVRFRCVLAAELEPDLRSLYAQNFPDIASDYSKAFPHEKWLRHRDTLRANLGTLVDALDIYNERGEVVRIHGDLRAFVDEPGKELRTWPDGTPMVPDHDLLCAGFPCQPFSKSGAQRGFDDVDGTVFHLISIILQERRPGIVLLENVGNFERHDRGNTWRRVKEILLDLGYEIKATTHVGGGDGGTGLLSPHHIGLPHHRERFFVAAQQPDEHRVRKFTDSAVPFPVPVRRSRAGKSVQMEEKAAQSLKEIISSSVRYATAAEFEKCEVYTERLRCAAHWQKLLEKIDAHDKAAVPAKRIQPMPSFPIWGFELDLWHHYPISTNPQNHLRVPTNFNKWRKNGPLKQIKALKVSSYPPTADRAFLRKGTLSRDEVHAFRDSMPGYAISREEWPKWKQLFLRQNREWAAKLWAGLDPAWFRQWLDCLFEMHPSHQKLEWNCQGEPLDLWRTILQFRPSGLRAKRFAHVPALVAMTTTQVPVIPRLVEEPGPSRGLGAKVRHLLPIEALQLQGFPATWKRPASRERTFQALGNAVNAQLVAEIFRQWFVPPSIGGDAPENSGTIGRPNRYAPTVKTTPTRRAAPVEA